MEKIVCGGNYTTNLIKDNINELIDENVLVKGGVTTLQSDVGNLEADLGTLQTDVTTLETDSTSLRTDVTTLQTDSTSLRTDVDGLKENTTLYNGIKTLPQIEGTALNVKGFYADTSVGGGQFYYDPLKDKTEHNGGTIISPEAIAAWDGSQGDLATLLDWTGTGSGCFVRLLADRPVFEHFGALGDGFTDDTVPCNKAANTFLPLAGFALSRYRLGTGDVMLGAISITGGGIDLDLKGAEIIQDGDFPAISVFNRFLDIQNISNITTGAVDLSNGDGNGTTSVAKLTVENASVYDVEDIVKIVSDDKIEGVRSSDNERIGEFGKISAIIGNDVYLYSYLRQSYTTNPRIARMQKDNIVKIYNGKINSSSTLNPSYSRPLVTITGCFNPYLSISSDYCKASLIEFESCLSPTTDNIVSEHQTTSFANFAYGYTIIEYSCEGGVHNNPKSFDARHVYTTGVKATSEGSLDVHSYGSTRDFNVNNGYGFNCQNSAFDTHPDAIGGGFYNCTAISPYNGPSGTQRNYQLRGVGCRLVNCKSVGGTGFLLVNSDNLGSSSKNNKLLNCEHEFLPIQQGTDRYALSVIGNPTNRMTGVIIDGLKVTQGIDNVTSMINIENANVKFKNLNLISRSNQDFTQKLITVGENSDVEILDSSVDLTESTAQLIRVLSIISDSARVRIRSLDVYENGNFYLADLNDGGGASTNGIIIAENVLTNNVMYVNTTTGGVGLVNVGPSATARVDYKTRYGSDIGANVIFETYNAGGNKTVNTRLRGGSEIFVNVTASSGLPAINNISQGSFNGQKMTIINSYSSTVPVTIKSGGVNLNIISDINLQPSESHSLTFVDGGWVG